jgi:hypothetical protein
MRCFMTWKVCLGVLVFSVLAWLPQGANAPCNWWSPAPCWGQEARPNPETIVVGSFSDNSVTGSSSIKGNTVTVIGTKSTFLASMSSSFAGFKGISQVNQAAGSINNQANSISVCSSPGQVSRIGQSYKSEIKDNSLVTPGNCYTASISGGSYAGGSGIAQVNQAAGNMNSQYNGFALNIGTGKGAVCLTDAELCNAKTNNKTIVKDSPSNNLPVLSADSDPKNNNFHGVFGSSQVQGDLNSVKTLFTVNVITAK